MWFLSVHVGNWQVSKVLMSACVFSFTLVHSFSFVFDGPSFKVSLYWPLVLSVILGFLVSICFHVGSLDFPRFLINVGLIQI